MKPLRCTSTDRVLKEKSLKERAQRAPIMSFVIYFYEQSLKSSSFLYSQETETRVSIKHGIINFRDLKYSNGIAVLG